ncbi:hypothetical protein [Glaciibacter psychrotolerans]|uniref:Cation transport ATPase n=1 Tax=Glaciibacter psychrotolerans TaxID=670054 RepID=A0A7Z0EFY4_9MICO|nr:hypothetical protein [Leifsonia psychrotolerans]NYJ20951.1 cation transport ATPase [Leifsonia psychrotolerans]
MNALDEHPPSTMTATDYARSVEATPGEFSWRKLERHAYDSYPQITAMLDIVVAELDSVRVSRWRNGRWTGAGLFIVVMYFAPLLIAVILRLAGEEVNDDPNTLLKWAATLTIGQIFFRIWEWVRAARGRRPAVNDLRLMVAATLFAFAASAWGGYIGASDYLPERAWLYALLFLLITHVCRAATVMMIARGRARERGELAFTLRSHSAVTAAIARLPKEEQDKIKKDLATALKLLATAGVISTNDQSDALTRGLGNLAPWRCSDAPLKPRINSIDAPEAPHL